MSYVIFARIRDARSIPFWDLRARPAVVFFRPGYSDDSYTHAERNGISASMAIPRIGSRWGPSARSRNSSVSAAIRSLTCGERG